MLASLAIIGGRAWILLVALALASGVSALYLRASRTQAGARGFRALAWVVLIGATLLFVFGIYILWFADFSWMDQG